MKIDFARIDLVGVDFVRVDLVAPNYGNYSGPKLLIISDT